MLLTQEQRERIERISNIEEISVGDRFYWFDEGAREDGIGTVESIHGDTVYFGDLAYTVGSMLWAKVHGAVRSGTLSEDMPHIGREVMQVEEPDTTNPIRGTNGQIYTLTNRRTGARSGDFLVRHGRTERGGHEWVGPYVLVSDGTQPQAEAQTEQPESGWLVILDEPSQASMDAHGNRLHVTEVMRQDNSDLVGQVVTADRWHLHDGGWWITTNNIHVRGALVRTPTRETWASEVDVLVVDLSGVDEGRGKTARTIPGGAVGLVRFDEVVQSNDGRTSLLIEEGDSDASRWYIQSYVPIRRHGQPEQETSEPEFVPTIQNPAPGVHLEDTYMAHEYTTWLTTSGEARRGFEPRVVPVTVTERGGRGVAGKNGYLLGVAPEGSNRTMPFVVAVQINGRWSTQYAAEVVAGHDQPTGWYPSQGEQVMLTLDYTVDSTTYQAGTVLRASSGGVHVEGGTIEAMAPDRSYVYLPFSSVAPVPQDAPPQAQALSGQALTDWLTQQIADAEQRERDLWLRLDQAAEDEGWCGDYEEFSRQVDGHAREFSPRRGRDYVFTVQADFEIDESTLDTLLRGHFSDMDITTNIQRYVTVTNQFEITFETDDPDDVDPDDLMQAIGITNANDVEIVDYTEAD